MNATDTLFTGRDILAAENYIRCSSDKDALRTVRNEMPAEVVIRLAKHVGAPADDMVEIVRRARLRYSER